ncbi:hypothetical protein QO019_005255 [Streptomyces thermodiastaticus]|uniref:Uncharacterized protein n=1 Tax=Streptomyces thermodiastaticus TaxID=44061 RepID=A0ABU0KLS3_9ACTN|nr:hypothetical protein [Streptomyces thermodiastaticus]
MSGDSGRPARITAGLGRAVTRRRAVLLLGSMAAAR